MKSYLILASFFLSLAAPGNTDGPSIINHSENRIAAASVASVEADVNARRPAKAKRAARATAKKRATRKVAASKPARKSRPVAAKKIRAVEQKKQVARTASKKVTHQKITAGKPVGKNRPIVTAKNVNAVGHQKKLYRGVRDINGISGGKPEKYIDNTFKNGMVSNHQLPINVPGVKVPHKGAKTDLLAHQKSAENSVFISTSSSKKVAKGFAYGKNSGVFVIKPKDSKPIDVNKTLGNIGIPEYKKEKEFAIANKINGNEITHFVTYDKNGKKTSKTKNPYITK